MSPLRMGVLVGVGAGLFSLACEPAEGDLIGAPGGGVSQGGAGGLEAAGGGGSSNGSAGGGTTRPGCAPVAEWQNDWEILEGELIDLINARRAAGGTCGSATLSSMDAVALHPTLRNVARAHAEDMSVNDYFGYTDLSGGSWEARIEACSNATLSAQAIAAGPMTAQVVFDSFVSEETTCQKLHGPGNVIGVGHYAGAEAQFPTHWAVYIGDTP